jgi:DNA-binding NarL/FixJ family response regulator
MSIRVAIADDQAMIRNGFRLQVQYADDLELVGEASNGSRPSPWPGPRPPTCC